MPREIRLLPLHQQILDIASDPGSPGLEDAEENPAPASIGEILGASLHYWKFPAGVKEASFGARKPQNSLTPYLRPPVERWVRDYLLWQAPGSQAPLGDPVNLRALACRSLPDRSPPVIVPAGLDAIQARPQLVWIVQIRLLGRARRIPSSLKSVERQISRSRAPMDAFSQLLCCNGKGFKHTF